MAASPPRAPDRALRLTPGTPRTRGRTDHRGRRDTGRPGVCVSSHDFLVRGRPARRREFVHGHPAWARLARADGPVDAIDALLRAHVEDPPAGHDRAVNALLEALVHADVESDGPPPDPATEPARRLAAGELLNALRAHDAAVTAEVDGLRPRPR